MAIQRQSAQAAATADWSFDNSLDDDVGGRTVAQALRVSAAATRKPMHRALMTGLLRVSRFDPM
jgi:hypothetical protein